MHFVFLTIPSSGQFNVQLATAHELLLAGHVATFISGSSFGKHINAFQANLLQQSDDTNVAKNVHFISLGDEHVSTSDFTPTVRTMLPRMRRAPGDIRSLQACTDIGHPSWEDHKTTAEVIAKHITQLQPDMIVVDVLSPAMVNGVRMTGRTFYLTIPCSPGLTVESTSLTNPHPAACHRNSGSLACIVESAYLRARDYAYIYVQRRSSTYRSKARRLRKQLGLPSLGGIRDDVSLLPPYWRDENCIGGIHFNVAGLLDCPAQPQKVCFVGAGIAMPTAPATPSSTVSATGTWLDQAQAANATVVYINMGSMFVWSDEEFQEMLRALTNVHTIMKGTVRFLFKAPIAAKKANDGSPSSTGVTKVAAADVPSYVRLSTWIEDQQAVYQHPAVKVFVHHGGGNSFNEAVFFGVPQMVISQWLDTHEYGDLVKRFGLGVHCRGAPHIRARHVQAGLLAMLADQTAWLAMKRASMHWAARSRIGGGPVAAAQLLIRNTANLVMTTPTKKSSSSPSSPSSMDEKRTDSCATSITFAS